MPTVNATHRKRLARALAAQLGITYMAALDAVTKAAAEGRLPSRLDEAGMAAALRTLSGAVGAGTGTRPLLEDLGVTPRQAADPRDQQIYDASAAYEALTGKQGLLYISSPGSGKDRYVFGGGHVCLGREEALTHILGLLGTVRAPAPSRRAAAGRWAGLRVRDPYVGEGADGARRSARIDREEVDGLDAADPRREGLLASAEAWEEQARLLDTPVGRLGTEPEPEQVHGECQHVRTEYRSQDGTYCVTCGELLASYATILADDGFHLEPAYLRLLRQVWQGRVTLTVRPTRKAPRSTAAQRRIDELLAIRDRVRRTSVHTAPTGSQFTTTEKTGWSTEEYTEYLSLTQGTEAASVRFAIDDQPASTIKDIELRWLADHGYIDTPALAPGDEWAVVRTTEFGEDVLAVNGANTDKFRDGLPAEAVAAADRAADEAAAGPKVIRHSDITRCPHKILFPAHYREDGSCLCFPDPADGPEDATEEHAGPLAGSQPEDRFTAGTVPATVRGLLKVRDEFVKAGRVEWWWHAGDFAGSHGFKTVTGVDEEDGSVILRDEDPGWMEPRTRLTLDYIDDPDRATQNLMWPDHSGLTLCDKRTGAIDATYRIAPPVPAPAAATKAAEPAPGSGSA